MLSFTGCSNKNGGDHKVEKIPGYTQVTAIESTEGEADIFRIESRGLYKIGIVKNLLNMVYNIKKSIYIYSVTSSKSGNDNQNKLQIIKSGKLTELNDFYTAMDLKVNSTADKVAFRSFKDNSLYSAEGMRIYDIENNKYVDLKSKVLVSGNLYGWINKNKIIYYGSIEGEKNSDKIYEYDFNNNRESVYLDNINGYCMYFAPIGENILFSAKMGDKSTLYYYDNINKTIKKVEYNISEMLNSVTDTKTGDIFFLGVGDDNNSALYKFSANNLTVERLTYDFPKSVDGTKGIVLDDKGNVYFCGTDTSNLNGNEDVFQYDVKEGSINLISTHEGKYSLYSSG
jgi:Tol biopolymer transport system component